MPAATSATNGSATVVTTKPMVRVRLVARLRPIVLGRYPASLAIFRIRSAVARLTDGELANARETVECDTRAIRATSLIERAMQTCSILLHASLPLQQHYRLITPGLTNLSIHDIFCTRVQNKL